MKRVFATIACLMLTGMAASAHEEGPDPLVQMLSALPVRMTAFLDAGLLDSEVSYFDFAATREMFGTNDFFTTGTPASAMAGSTVVAGILLESERYDMRDAIGIGIDDVAQAMYVGQPPLDLLILKGDFDASAITTALERLNFDTFEGADAETIFCNAAGCDAGARSDRNAVEEGNPFGGWMGLRQRLSLLESDVPGQDFLIGARALPLVEGTVQGLRALSAESLTADAYPILDVLYAESGGQNILGLHMFPGDSFIFSGSADFSTLAVAALAASPDEQSTLLALLLPQDIDVDGLPEQLDEALGETSFVTGDTYRQMLEQREFMPGDWMTAESDEGYPALILQLGSANASNRGPILLLTMIYQSDIGWLLPVLD